MTFAKARGPLTAVLMALMFVGVPPTKAAAEEKRPNVVFILADNVGYGDLGPYGGGELRGFPTPRADHHETT
jgi:arylsulfatase